MDSSVKSGGGMNHSNSNDCSDRTRSPHSALACLTITILSKVQHLGPDRPMINQKIKCQRSFVLCHGGIEHHGCIGGNTRIPVAFQVIAMVLLYVYCRCTVQIFWTVPR